MHDSPPDDNGKRGRSTAIKLLKALTYQEYLLAYPELASTMQGRSREVRISADDQYFFSTFRQPVHLVTVAASDSSSTPVVIPILEHLGRSLPHCSFWIMDPEPGNELLRFAHGVPHSRQDIGACDLPVLFVFDGELRYLTDWGPHPQGFASRWDAWIAEHPEPETNAHDAAFTSVDPLHEIRLWYNSGLTTDCIVEIRKRLAVLSDDSTDGAEASGSVVVESEAHH